MKFKVFFDSNQLFNRNGPLGEPFDNTIHDLHEFLEKNNILDKVTVCLPEVVIKERIRSKLEDIEDKIVGVNDRIRSLKSLGYDLKEVESLTIDEHKEMLTSKVEEVIKKYSLQEVSNKEIDVDNLIDKSIAKIKPFNDQGVGLKDTLIFLSIIDDANEDTSADVYIFCSNNSKQFGDEVAEQFAQATDKQMIIVNNVEGVKEKLDELVPLELHLEERNDKIRELIMKKVGTITKQINDFSSSSLVRDRYPYRRPSVSEVTSLATYGLGRNKEKDEEVVSGYDYKSIALLNFEEVLYGEFSVDAVVCTDIIYRDKNENKRRTDSYGVGMTLMEQIEEDRNTIVNWGGNNGFYNNMFKPSTKDFHVTIRCNLDTGTINVSNIF